MITITGQTILDAIGVPPASQVDQDWADGCAAAVNAFVNALPVASDDAAADQAQQGGVMLGVNLYRRRPAGVLSPDSQPDAAAAVDGTISRLLRLGFYQKPVIG